MAQLAVCIQDALTQSLPAKVRVVGEVSNLSDRAHWFFSLKDEEASIRCVCFASNARRIRTPIRDGMEVVATGRVDYYGPQGQLQLYVDNISPVGVGELELRYRALCDEMRKAGYFDVERKKQLPLVPRRIAVVTSRSAAALQDVINTAHRRWPACELVLVDVRVQGGAAAPEVAQAIADLSEHGESLGIDAIIVTRGGGSIEDLWAFNEREVAEALFECTLPVVAAIGHETDTTIAELVADVRCATPTQAAMTLVPDQAALLHQVDQAHSRLRLLTQQRLQHARQRFEAAARFALFRRPASYLVQPCEKLKQLQSQLAASLPRRVASERQRLGGLERHLVALSPTNVQPHREQLDAIQRRLEQSVGQRSRSARQQLDAMARQLQAVGPKQVLDRGYSYTKGEDGRILTDAAHAADGERITTVLSRGELNSRVEKGDSAASPPAPKPSTPAKPKPRQRKKKKAEDENQLGLF